MKHSQEIFCALILVLANCIYSKGYNPYNPGQFSTDSIEFLPTPDGIPLHSLVFFPQSPSQFAPIIFIGGLYGYVVSEFYSTLLEDLASHGYIAIGIDRYYPGHPRRSLFRPMTQIPRGRLDETPSIELFFNTSQWLKTHLTNQIVAKADWSKITLLCHSAGCDDTLVMVNLSRTFAQASVFLDPMSFNAVTLQPISSKVKILSFMSQLSEEKPKCCLPETDYKKIYGLFNCTKVKMQVKDFGHCDILDDILWESCHLVNACKTTNSSRLSVYKDFTTGAIDGFLQWTLYGHSDMRNYVTSQSYMPLPLVDLAYSSSC